MERYLAGNNAQAKGYITQFHFLAGRAPAELERRLGFSVGMLGEGWSLLFMKQLPAPEQFQFRGHTHFSGGMVQGHLPNPPDRRTAEQRLKDDGYDIAALKKNILKNTFRIQGPQRLVKIIPNRRGAYPVGSGIPQWELMEPMRFFVKANVQAGEPCPTDYAG